MNDMNKIYKTYDEVFYDYTIKEIKDIIGNKAYVSHKVPVIIAYNFNHKKKIYETKMQCFKSLGEMKEFINKNKGIVIYKMFKTRDETGYGMKFFDGLKFRSRLEFWYNNIRIKLAKCI